MALATRRSSTLTSESPAHAASGWDVAGFDDGQPGQPNEKHTRPPLEPLRLLGQTLVWLGGLLLLFAVFQLWGTGLLEWRAQRGLDAEFDQLMAEATVDAAEPAAVPATEADGQTDATTDLEDTNADLPDVGVATAPAPVAPPSEHQSELVAVTADSKLLPPEGAPIARIDIPAIGVRKTIVQGIERQTLRAGPGHYPTTPMPGQPGNAAIAGHRTTHGSPFLEIDRLEPGDHIDVETVDGVYRYVVEAHRSADGSERGHFIVHPSEVDVIADQGDDRLTLTACHPRYSARQRIIVTALLIGEPSPEPVVVADQSLEPVDDIADDELFAERSRDPIPNELGTTTAGSGGDQGATTQPSGGVDSFQTVGGEPNSLEESLGWRMDELIPTMLWATIFAVVAFAGWMLDRFWLRRWVCAAATPVALVPLFVCFIHLDRLLPAF